VTKGFADWGATRREVEPREGCDCPAGEDARHHRKAQASAGRAAGRDEHQTSAGVTRAEEEGLSPKSDPDNQSDNCGFVQGGAVAGHWRRALCLRRVTPETAAGPTQFGNLEANERFLDQTGLLCPGIEMLEIGSGTGTLLHRLLERGYRIQGVDINPALLDDARRWYGDLPVHLVQGTTLPFPDASFDVVMSFDVFEHIPDTDAHLDEVWRVLRPGGTYVMQTPNKWTNVVFETIRWRSFTKFREDHCSLHSLAELRRTLARHRFTPRVWNVPVVNDFFRAKVRRYLGRPGVAALGVLNPDRLPLPLRTNLYVTAEKRPAGAPTAA
jgi:SAM-dependent methyltransferase